MTLDQLRYFESAARLSHIGKAAAKEHISQPSLSIAIKKLEQELGVPLFAPNGRGIIVTEQGKEFLPYVQNILTQVQQATEQMQGVKDRLNREIHMAYTATMSYSYIPKLFKNFLASTNRNYLIYSDEMPTDEIVGGLRDGRFDFGICSRIAADPEIVQQELFYQPLVLIAPKESSAADYTSPQALCLEPFVSYRPDYPMYRQVTALFESLGLNPRTSYFAYSEDAIARFVEQGLGISIVAETDSLNYYGINILRPDWLTEGRYIYLTYAKHKFRGKAVAEMMEYIAENSRIMAGTP